MDLDKYDEISKMEDIVENLTNILNISKTRIMNPKKEEQIKYILTIISVLYKQKCYEEYLETLTQTSRTEDIKTLEELIIKLKTSLENDTVLETSSLIKKYGLIIQEYIKQYFIKKHTNYITEKHQTQLIINDNKQKELLQLNPLIINQLLKVIKQPLTKEEQIIEDIIEFIIESQQIYIDKKEQQKYIKKLIKNKYKDKETEALSFLISNIYQELKENPLDENANIIIPIIENEKITKQHILNEFLKNDKFSNIILDAFEEYNMEIKQGRLEELEQKTSSTYAKRIYRKNP